MASEKRVKVEFGDFQTPLSLAREACSLIAEGHFSPASILEPTCGRGSFLQAAIEVFRTATHFVGVDRNAEYVAAARVATRGVAQDKHVQIFQGDFFATDWEAILATLPRPLLILGNPPWVTNSALGALGSENLPAKENQDNLRGIDALTGKSNFDISEWMLRKNLEWLAKTPGMLAVLCKTAVARRVLSFAWSHGLPLECAAMRRIDARQHFGAAVDACLLLVKLQPGESSRQCADFDSLGASEPRSIVGVRDGDMVADVRLYDQWRSLLARGLTGWRSGVKHDCSDVFELVQRGSLYENGLGHRVDVESEALFPLLKSSDLAKNRRPRKWLIVPQRSMAGSPEQLQRTAPKAWQYLVQNAERLQRRGSSIYRNRPRFSIFGIGEYSFAPWKVAISGLYKRLEFVVVPPYCGKPVMLDDTCYFFPCNSERECTALHQLVQSTPAREFWSAFIFWDSKRPITAQVLNLLDFAALGRLNHVDDGVVRRLAEQQRTRFSERAHQQLLFDTTNTLETAADSIAADAELKPQTLRTADNTIHSG